MRSTPAPSPNTQTHWLCLLGLVLPNDRLNWSSFLFFVFLFLSWGSKLRLNSHASGVSRFLYQCISVAMDGA